MTLNESKEHKNSLGTNYRVDRSIDILRSVLHSISSQWTSSLKTGWREFPDKGSEPPNLSFDIWSTSHALEMLCGLLVKFRLNGYTLSQEIEDNCKKAIIEGASLLLQNQKIERQSEILPPPRISNQKPDVIGLVWQLRAITEILKASKTLSLPIQTELLFKKGEFLLQELFVYQDPNGGWSSFGTVGKSSYVTAMAVWAIAEAYPIFEGATYLRPHKVHGTHIAIEWLLKNRTQTVGIPFFEGGRIASISRTALTSIAIWARRQMKCSEPIPENEIALNNSWVIEHQDQSGGWFDDITTEAEPDVEVTAIVLLALLKCDTYPTHPVVCKAIDWLLASFKIEEETRSGWGIYPISNLNSGIRIWTTWYSSLALWEYILHSGGSQKDSLRFSIVNKPKIIFTKLGSTKVITIRLKVEGTGDSWVYLNVIESNAGLEIQDSKLMLLTKNNPTLRLKIRQLESGIIKCNIKISDIINGNTILVPLKIVAFGRIYKTLVGTLADPRVLTASLAISSAIYTFLKYGNKVTLELAFDVLYIALGTFLIILIFSSIKYFFEE